MIIFFDAEANRWTCMIRHQERTVMGFAETRDLARQYAMEILADRGVQEL